MYKFFFIFFCHNIFIKIWRQIQINEGNSTKIKYGVLNLIFKGKWLL